MKHILIKSAALAASMALAFATVPMSAQSRSFKLGQWEEIHSSLVRELNRSYVDSLPLDRMMRAGIDAMLSELDPYTVYVPGIEMSWMFFAFDRILSTGSECESTAMFSFATSTNASIQLPE